MTLHPEPLSLHEVSSESGNPGHVSLTLCCRSTRRIRSRRRPFPPPQTLSRVSINSICSTFSTPTSQLNQPTTHPFITHSIQPSYPSSAPSIEPSYQSSSSTAITMIDPLAPLRPLLVPYTSNLPSIIRQPLESLLTEQCYPILVENLDILSSPTCTRLAISKALGIGIIAASSIVKLPQLLSIVNAKSASGVSLSSYVLETLAYLVTLSYSLRAGFPVTSYGETGLLVVQNVAIALAIAQFTSGQGRATQVTLLAGLGALVYALLFSSLISLPQLQTLQAATTIPLSLLAKLPQIATIHAAGHTGRLSTFAVVNYLLGSVARVFTSATETGDKVLVAGYVAGAVLNAVLMAQVVYYWGAGAKARVEKKKQ